MGLHQGKESVKRVAYSYRFDPQVPAFPDDKPIIVFDGVCVLCSSFVQFVLKRDSEKQFRFIAAQSPLGAALYRHFRLDPIHFETNILIENGQAWFKSEGSVRMFVKLGFPWRWMILGKALPLVFRDFLYKVIASHRYQWFGQTQTCYLPPPGEQSRFIA